MKAIFNFREIDTTKPQLFFTNRAFCYGDGLFETIVTGPERNDLIDLHLDRLQRGAEALDMQIHHDLTATYLRETIQKLAQQNGIEGNIRTKLILWRDTGGLYAPEKVDTHFFMESKASTKTFYRLEERIGISEHYRNSFSPYSFAKRTNALHYVMAGKEMKEKAFSEIILLDQRNRLSETHIGNLFWTNGKTIFTPALSTGCIDGILRTAILEAAEIVKIPLEEVLMTEEALENATSIWSTNASGIVAFRSFKGKALEDPRVFLKPLIKQLLPL